MSGLALFGAGLALFLTLASFDPNVVQPRDRCRAGKSVRLARRTARGPAAHAFGWAALVPVLGCLGWAWRAIGKRPMRRLGLQSFALLLAMVLLSSAMATVPPPGWPIAAGGGAVGSLLLAWLVAVTAGVPLAGRAPIAILAFLAGAGAGGWGMGVSIADWRLFGRTVRAGAIRLRVAASQIAKIVAKGASIVQPRPLIDDVPAAASTADRIPDVRKSALVESRSTRVRARPHQVAAQRALDFEAQQYRLPPLDLPQLPPPQSFGDVISRNARRQNARMLVVLDDFGVRGEIVKVRPGPVITLYELEPAPVPRVPG